MTPDVINSYFELTAGVLLTANIWRIHRDKKVRGVSVIPLAFMVLWGLWNCVFYPSVGAMWSFWAGAVCTTINAIWIAQIFYYKRQEKRHG